MLNRLNRRIWYCRRIQPGEEGYQEGAALYRPPVPRLLNVLPVSGETILASGGELSEHYLKARLTAGSPEGYEEQDIVFIYRRPAGEFDPADPGGDYAVQSVLPGHGVTELILRELVEGRELGASDADF